MVQNAVGWPLEGILGDFLERDGNHKTFIWCGQTKIHKDQAIIERFNKTLAKKLFSFQYGEEMVKTKRRSTPWVKRLPEVVAALNNEKTSIIGKKFHQAIKEKKVFSKPSLNYKRPFGFGEKRVPSNMNVWYLYQPGELEGRRERATDPNYWSLKVYQIERIFVKPNAPIMYYLRDGP